MTRIKRLRDVCGKETEYGYQEDSLSPLLSESISLLFENLLVAYVLFSNN